MSGDEWTWKYILVTKFYKSGKWRNNKNCFITNAIKTYGKWIAFCCFAFKTELTNLLSFLWKTLLNWNIKTMTSKKLGGLLMKFVRFISYYFSKKLTCVSIGHKYLKRQSLIKILRFFSEYICRQLKYHQHRVRSKTGISSETIASVFKFLTVSLNSTIFCLFQLVSSVNLIWCQMLSFYCPLNKKSYAPVVLCFIEYLWAIFSLWSF